MTRNDKINLRLQRLARLFKESGKPVHLTGGQLDIFRSIVFPEHKRVQIITCTQYGKSFTVALACIILTCILGKKVAVVAPNNEKAKQIMRYYIMHLKDSPLFWSTLEKNTKLDRLEQEESKERIMLNNGGGIFVVSCQAGNSTKGIEAAMGAGAEIVIGDEFGLVPDIIEATIYRMIAGKGENAVYIKIGNPFYRNQFYKSSKNPTYHQIKIDYRQAIAEGRYNEDFITEARTKPFFDVLYEANFPADDLQDALGYLRLLTDQDVDISQGRMPDGTGVVGYELGIGRGKARLGVDIGEGGDPSAYVLRYNNWATVLETNRDPDLMSQIPRIKKYQQLYSIEDALVFIDDIGVGSGIGDRTQEMGFSYNQVKVSRSAGEDDRYINQRAENYWNCGVWVKDGGLLDPDSSWNELADIRFKENSDSRLKIKSKQEMAKEGIHSPNIADALMLTFSDTMVTTANDFL